jgi:site-specific recombinase XerC
VVQGTSRARVSEARAHLRQLSDLTGQSARRFDEIVGRFERFLLNGFGVEQLSEITAAHVEQFVRAKGASGAPSASTMQMRRTSLRLLFRIARTELDFEGDPTLDLQLPPKSRLAARPLTDDEVALGRSFSLHTQVATRLPAAWALGEATATTAELPHIVVSDLDLDCAAGPRVWLHGSNKRDERWGFLDDWGALQLQRRASSLRGTDRLIYKGSNPEEDGQRSCCASITDTLVRAGLASEPDVRPISLVAWAGTVVLEETDKIERVARRLGMRSLDAAARLIGLDW